MGSESDMVEAGVTLMALIERAREEGIDRDEYDRMMEPGLTDTQADIASDRAGEGRIQLDRDDIEIPTLLDKLEAQAKLPWMFTLDGEWFVVKTSVGESGGAHSKWWWVEDGYEFVFYKPKRDDCVPNIEILERDE